MRILIIDQCSSAKKGNSSHSPIDDEMIDSNGREELLDVDGVPVYSAAELYQGRQQKRIDEAVSILADTDVGVDRVFISAGFGVVDANDRLPLYDVTFSECCASEVDERAERLEIHVDLRELIDRHDYDLIFLPLGRDYCRSARLEKLLSAVARDTRVVLFNQEELAKEHDNVLSLPARTTDAKRYGTIVVALKGQYIRNFAEHLSTGGSVQSFDDIERYCTQSVTDQAGLDDY